MMAVADHGGHAIRHQADAGIAGLELLGGREQHGRRVARCGPNAAAKVSLRRAGRLLQHASRQFSASQRA